MHGSWTKTKPRIYLGAPNLGSHHELRTQWGIEKGNKWGWTKAWKRQEKKVNRNGEGKPQKEPQQMITHLVLGDTEQLWYAERRKRITASRVAGIAKMRKNTKTANKVKEMLYTKFRGNAHTLYGVINESTSRNEYITYMHNHGHTGLTVSLSGLTISQQSPWIAASPDGMVLDPSHVPSEGLVELKNPSSVQDMTIVEACEMKKGFCIKKRQGTVQLDRNHDYYYQVQCQLYCTERAWCDFVVRTKKDLYIERIQFDQQWWQNQLPKIKTFYFNALLPELACPRHHTGGIREPTQSTWTLLPSISPFYILLMLYFHDGK